MVFRLVPYFSISSLVAFVIVTILFAVMYRQTAVADLIELQQVNNVALTQIFANSLWSDFADFVDSASDLSIEELRNHHEMNRLNAAVLAQMQGLSVIKVKVYNLNALTVFSTEAAQIGEDKSTNAGYLAARAGGVATELTHRDTFSAFEQMIEDRDVISSYIPIRRGPDSPIEGVFEIYDDVTPLLNRIEITQQSMVIRVILILTVLYVVLYLIVRRGERIIRRQITERLTAERARQEVETRLHTVINSAPVMFWVIDTDKKLTLLEGRGLKNWGIHSEQAVGKFIGEVYPNAANLEKDIDQALSGKDHISITHINDYTFDTRYTPLHDDKGKVVGVIGVATDITERMMAESALGEMNFNLERRNQQLERVHEFLNSTMEAMNDSVRRGANQTELLIYLDQARAQFKRLS